MQSHIYKNRGVKKGLTISRGTSKPKFAFALDICSQMRLECESKDGKGWIGLCRITGS